MSLAFMRGINRCINMLHRHNIRYHANISDQWYSGSLYINHSMFIYMWLAYPNRVALYKITIDVVGV